MVLPDPNQPEPEPPEDLAQFLPNHNPKATLKLDPIKIKRLKVCPKCGYNLRGLTLGHPCPECGRASHKLANTTDFDLEYLGRLTWGFRFLLFAWFLMLPVMPIVAFMRMEFEIVMIAATCGYFLTGLGTFLTTVQDRATVTAKIKPTLRNKTARIIVIVGSLPVALWCYSILTATIFVSPSPIWFLVAMFILLIHQSSICFAARTIAREMQDDKLSAKYYFLGFAIPIVGLIGLPMSVALLSTPAGFVFLVLFALPLIFGILEIVFMTALYSSQSASAWAIRYQYHEEAKNQRLRDAFTKPPEIDKIINLPSKEQIQQPHD